MSRSKEMAKRFREVILDGKWVAFTNMKEQISDIDWEQANIKIRSLNSLAALTFHLNYYIAGTLEVFEGRDLTIRDKYSWEMDPITNQTEWIELRSALFSNSEKFAGHVEKLTDEKLEEFFVKEDYGTYSRNIEGMIEHCYYHFGQAVIIKKMVMEAQ